MNIINGHILTMAGKDIKNGYVKIENAKIAEVGDMTGFDGFGDIVDADGGFVMPGFVDAHTHIGMWEDALGFEGDDGNEDVDPITPHIRALDGLNPMDRCFREALVAGVTSVLVGPGSANPVAGQMVAMKTRGICIDEMVIAQPAAVKFALGENPKGVYHGKNQSPVTRMATAAIIRETLCKTRDYMKKLEESKENDDVDPPEYDFKCESLIPLLKGEIPAHFHAHRADDIFTAVRIAKEFGLKYSIVHATEAHLVAGHLDKETGLILGPLLSDRSKPELANQTCKSPAILAQEGFRVAICTDHPELPERYLLLSTCAAVKEGMDRGAALRSITIDAAFLAGIDHRVGSLEAGKDADVLIFDSHPLDFYASLTHVFSDGEQVALGLGDRYERN